MIKINHYRRRRQEHRLEFEASLERRVRACLKTKQCPKEYRQGAGGSNAIAVLAALCGRLKKHAFPSEK